MNSLHDFRKQLTNICYNQDKPFRKAMDWKTWAKADVKLLILNFRFYRDAESILLWNY